MSELRSRRRQGEIRHQRAGSTPAYNPTSRPDGVVGTNCLDFGTQKDFDDLEGHGTFVGGLVGALDNKIGRVGIAPGARLFGVRVLDETGFGSDAEVICGIDWVTGTRLDGNPHNDIAVSNMSLGGFERRGRRRTLWSHRRRLRALRHLRLDQGGSHHSRGCRE